MAEKLKYETPTVEIVEPETGGNTGLPFGLCKKYGIETQKNWTPRDAWNALKGELGIDPEDVYKELDKEKTTEIKPIKNDYIREILQKNNVESIPVNKLKHSLTEQEIINKIGGYDYTGGSCVSCALAYLGNKKKLDVKDFRGGKSMKIIREWNTLKQLAKSDGINGIVLEEFNDFVAADMLFKQMEENKEYYYVGGRHAAIIKKEKGELQYLELQTRKENGFKPLTRYELKDRFGCKSSHSNKYLGKYKRPSILIEAENLIRSEDFENILPYINTEKEKKGKE